MNTPEQDLMSAVSELEAAERGDPHAADRALAILNRRYRVWGPLEPNARLLAAYALRLRFDRDAAPIDLDNALELLDSAADLVAQDDAMLTFILAQVSLVLRMQFEIRGTGDIGRAVMCARAALDRTPIEDPTHASRAADLAQCLQTKFERFGDRQELDEAVGVAEHGLEVGGSDLARLNATLAGCLAARYAVEGRGEDIDRAVQHAKLAALSGQGARKPLLLVNLATVLLRRHERTHDSDDLSAAIEAARSAAEMAPTPVHRTRPLFVLAAALQTRARRSMLPYRDLAEAVSLLDEAAIHAKGDVDRTAAVINAADARRELAHILGSTDLAADAVRRAEQAVELTARDPRNRATASLLLALALLEQMEIGADGEDLARALKAAESAARTEEAAPDVRAAAWQAAGDAAALMKAWPVAADAYTAAISQLATVGGRGAVREDQEHWLARSGRLAADAMAACLNYGDVERALEVGQHGRQVLLGRRLDLRAQFRDLSSVDPSLSARLVQLANELRIDDRHMDADLRRRLGIEFDHALGQARQNPGFERLLQPVPMEELRHAAREGSVVVLNVSRLRSDAVVLRPDDWTVVQLPEAGVAAVEERVRTMLELTASGDTAAANRRLSDLLAWLWDAVVKPVLDAVETLGVAASAERPRIVWNPFGPLALLPLHAAGRHPGGASESAIDQIVSSYTPTIGALLDSIQRGDEDQVPPPATSMVVAMPQTPGERDLPSAARELRIVRDAFGGDVVGLVGDCATFDSVQAAMRDTRWAHFACHATADPGDPSSARLLLSDHLVRPLSVRDLVQWEIEDADFAFLSACGTAERWIGSADEALPLATAFQLAGFRTVVATLWPVRDRVAARAAQIFYERIGPAHDPSAAVTALNDTVRRLRDEAPHLPLLWASLVVAGA